MSLYQLVSDNLAIIKRRAPEPAYDHIGSRLVRVPCVFHTYDSVANGIEMQILFNVIGAGLSH